MNRRGFLRGAISVMAVAAILKGRMPAKEGLVNVEGNLTTYFHMHPEQEKLYRETWLRFPRVLAMRPGEYLKVSGALKYDHNDIYTMDEIVAGLGHKVA